MKLVSNKSGRGPDKQPRANSTQHEVTTVGFTLQQRHLDKIKTVVKYDRSYREQHPDGINGLYGGEYEDSYRSVSSFVQSAILDAIDAHEKEYGIIDAETGIIFNRGMPPKHQK